MATDMRERKVTTKLKSVVVGLVAAVTLAGSGYAFGVHNTPVTSAVKGQQQAGETAAKGTDLGDETTLITNAIDFHYGQEAVKANQAYYPKQVYHIALRGDNATAKVYTGDTGAQIFLHKINTTNYSDGARWEVIWDGQFTPDQATVSKYGIPNEWVNPQD